MKRYTLDEVTDEIIGVKGTRARDLFEKKLKLSSKRSKTIQCEIDQQVINY